jgi:drug/metabolite transporter (DMT)-like permease
VIGVGGDAALSFVCAGAAAIGNAGANVAQRKASLDQPPEWTFGPRLIADLVRRPIWLIGFGGMVASFVLQALALGLGQLSAVEPVITLEVPLTLLVASRVFRVRMGRPEWTGIWVMTASMIVLVAVLDARPGNESAVTDQIYLEAGVGTAAFVVVLLAMARRGHRLWRTACLGAAAGTSFGLTATLVKETVARLNAKGIVAILTTWQTYAAVAVGLAGVLIMQAALHNGPLLAAQPGFTLMDPLVSILWGVLVFHETVRGGVWLVPAFLAATGIAAGVVLLARSPLLSSLSEDSIDHPASAGPDRNSARAAV